MLDGSNRCGAYETGEIRAMAADSVSTGPGQPQQGSEPLLHAFSPRQVAGLIRGIDSRLVGIDYAENMGERALVYIFEVAGKRQQFRIAAPGATVASIADLYPEAAPQEHELQHQFGLVFLPPSLEDKAP
jgi:hypothetical protein